MSVRCQTTEQRLSLPAALLSSDSLHLVPKTISPFHSVAVAALRPSPSSLSFHPAHIQFLHNASVSLKSDSADPPSGGMLLRAHARFAAIRIFAVIESCDQKMPDASTSVCLAAISYWNLEVCQQTIPLL